MNRGIAPWLLAVLLAGLMAPEADAEPAHYFVFEIDDSERVAPLFHRVVELAARPPSQSDDRILRARGRRDVDEASVLTRLWDQRGDLVHQEMVLVPSRTRTELPAADPFGPLTHHSLPNRRRTFVLRLPRIAEGSLVIEHGAEVTEFSLSELIAVSQRLPLAAAGRRLTRMGLADGGGDPANRVDILIMGDGYTAAEQAKFEADAETIGEAFLRISPYAEYSSFVNLNRLFTPSQESGADHPAFDPACPSGSTSCCSDEEARADPLAGTFVQTAYDASYCVANLHRLLVVDPDKVLADASAAPNWDQIIVLVNDSTYGGSGGFPSVVSTHTDAGVVLQHEYGHAFTALADEYDEPLSGFPPCSDLAGSPHGPCEPNVTDETHRNLIKWAPWIDAMTPIPTPEGSGFFSEVGLFHGGRYRTSGMYRPRDQRCLMRSLDWPFCEVCAQAYVLKLYRGGWGVPATGIDLIEPGSENPPPGPVGPGQRDSVTFSVDLVQPETGVEIEWNVNGVTQEGETGPSFVLVADAGEQYDIELVVRDPTSLVHPQMDPGNDLVTTRRWSYPPPDEPDVTVDFLKRNFGDVAVGTSAPLRKLTLTNDGTQPLQVFAIKIRGVDRARFTLPSAEDGCSDTTLAPGQSCRLRVGFEPDTVGLRKALAVITTNDPDEGEIRVQLRGSGALLRQHRH